MSKLFEEKVHAIDPAYINIRDGNHPILKEARDFVEQLWSFYQGHADKHFLVEIKRDFHARFWEMYLANTLDGLKISILCRKPGPDILAKDKNQKAWIEAIAPNNGQPGSPDYVPKDKFGNSQSVPDEKVVLRYTSAISEKYKKYFRYLEKGIILRNEPYIIAINGGQVRFSRSDYAPPRIVRSVFPIGYPVLTLNRKSMEIIKSSFEFKPNVKKASGTDIPIDIFLDPYFENLSGVLFSATDACNRPPKIGADFIFVHNPLAKNKINEGFIRVGKEYIAEPVSVSEYRLRFNNWNYS